MVTTQNTETRLPEPVAPATEAIIEPVEPAVILSLLDKNGPMTTNELTDTYGRLCGRNFRSMFSAMDSMALRGIVAKSGEGELVTWSIPESEAAPAEKTTAEIVNEIPGLHRTPG